MKRDHFPNKIRNNSSKTEESLLSDVIASFSSPDFNRALLQAVYEKSQRLYRLSGQVDWRLTAPQAVKCLYLIRAGLLLGLAATTVPEASHSRPYA